MNRSPLLLIAAALALGCMPAITPPPVPAHRAVSEPSAADTSIGAASFAWSSAVAQGDTASAERILDDQFIGQAADGSTRTKPGVLHAMSNGTFPVSGTSTVDEQVQRIGDVAIVASRAWWERRESAPRDPGMYRTTDVFVRRPAGWRLVSEQMALVQPARITARDSIDAMRWLRQTLELAGETGRSHSVIVGANGSTSAFAEDIPYRMDDDDVKERALGIIDAPRRMYEMTPPIAEPFVPERLRLQMLAPDAAVATFEIDGDSTISRRTLVLRRNQGYWYLAHVHASSVPRVPRTLPPGAHCESNAPPELPSDPAPPLESSPSPSRMHFAPGNAGITGTVVTPMLFVARSTRPVPNALVSIARIDSVSGMPRRVLRTDSTGSFSAGLAPGRYAVTVHRILYRPVTDTVELRRDSMRTVRYIIEYHVCVGS